MSLAETGLYFVFDPEGEGFRTFATVEARDRFAERAIAGHLSEGWDEGVTNVVAGAVTHRVMETDRVDRPSDEEIDEEGFDEAGNDWIGDHDYLCRYRLKVMPAVR